MESEGQRNVLYFPYIRVPQSDWFTRVLLYWDQVGSIVPHEYAQSAGLGEYMGALVREDLVKPIYPGEHIGQIPHFAKAFLDYVDSPKYPVKGILRKKKGIFRRKSVPAQTFSLHMEKTRVLGHELSNKGLALEPSDPIEHPWYNVEAYTANQFMAYLAASLGKLPEINSEPITDTIQNLNSFTPDYHEYNKLPEEIDQLRTIVLEDTLPAPQGWIDPGILADFKSDHKTELTRFRDNLESFLMVAAGIENTELRARSIKEYKTKIHGEMAEIKKLMEAKGWKKLTLGRFLGYSTAGFGLAAAISTAAATVATGGILAVVAAAFGITAAVQQHMTARRILEGKTAAYAVLAQKEFGRV